MKEIKKQKNNLSNESGIALIIALVMLLVMSVMAISVSFLSNTDFQSMSNFKRGQEAFLAAETCVQETRRQIAEQGLALLLFKQSAQVGSDTTLVEPLDMDLSASNDALATDSKGVGAVCRSGNRMMTESDKDPIFIIPENVKSIERALREYSLPDSGSGGAKAIPIIFTIMGKDSQDRDKNDSVEKLDLNTGTQLAVGIETFTGGGASNVY